MRGTVYVFCVRDGSWVEATLLSLHGDDVRVRWRGAEWDVARWLVTKDPDEIKRMRMSWEKVQGIAHGN